jgi:hypothetical protein
MGHRPGATCRHLAFAFLPALAQNQAGPREPAAHAQEFTSRRRPVRVLDPGAGSSGEPASHVNGSRSCRGLDAEVAGPWSMCSCESGNPLSGRGDNAHCCLSTLPRPDDGRLPTHRG